MRAVKRFSNFLKLCFCLTTNVRPQDFTIRFDGLKQLILYHTRMYSFFRLVMISMYNQWKDFCHPGIK